MADRRTHLRYQINLPVFIFYSGKRDVAHTLDVGLGGMKLYSSQGIPSGREILFQLVMKRTSVWLKGRLVFEQTDPELVRFSCVSFSKTTTNTDFELQEFLSGLETLLQRDSINMMLRMVEGQSAFGKGKVLFGAESQRWKQRQQILKELRERIETLSSEFPNYEGEKLKMAVQRLHDSIEAMTSAIINGLKTVHIILKGGNVPEQIPCQQIIFNIEKNYIEIRKILDNLPDFIQ